MNSSSSTSSFNRKREWRSCYLKAMGWDEGVLDNEQQDEEPSSAALPTIQESSSPPVTQPTFVNLVPSSPHNDSSNDDEMHQQDVDGWMKAFLEIEHGLYRMIDWLHEKKWTFLHPDTSAQEASLIQSTVTSYAATVAKELEGLRQMLHQPEKLQQQQHRHSMVQVLLAQLTRDVAEPFGRLQKQRQRLAVQLWQSPLDLTSAATPIGVKKKKKNPVADEMDAMLGLDDNDDDNQPSEPQPFLPTQPHHSLQQGFLESYYRQEETVMAAPWKRPKSVLLGSWIRGGTGGSAVTASSDPSAEAANSEAPLVPSVRARSTPPRPKQPSILPASSAKRPDARLPYQQQQQENDNDDDQLLYTNSDELQQEAALLFAKMETDLQEVQQMESTMVDIVNLLTQFSNLVASQQEDVVEIATAVQTSKKNVEQGQDQLVDAKERTAASHHYMAKSIFALGLVLLVFHWIRP